MDLTPYINSLRDDLTATASAGDEQTRRAAGVLSAALEPSVRLALMNALADLAAEVTASLPDHVVDVRLDGRDVRVVVTPTGNGEQRRPEPEEEPSPPPRQTPPFDGGDISRITLRLFENIKGQAEQAAAAQGMSLNSFVTQAVQGALQGKQPWSWDKPRRSGGDNHMHGWVRGDE
ncbi:toxin-antitoxin system HicB family antitoxin [Amycolatopsis suaedae]|uniref:Toxin-antitoxin system HicB family antitoxin n=1 Tax=Amycolatopsis suaedae TaxID=2510978 RepID=A0A4Q7J0A4_9PSEU|nr:toxin-antitoxin system HicB family antitoxin [Amycolatopsis suaedae]RZQ59793.1 toxin-antitoxin system HicB family antitoxin [Amycolatopsis suaedae]